MSIIKPERILVSLVAPLIFVSAAHAQLDPSSAFLLNTGSSSNAVESSRYQIRPKAVATRRAPAVGPAVEAPKTEAVVVAEEKPVPTPVPVATPVVVETPVRTDSILDISIAPGFVYNNSDSAYSFRKYTAAAPVLGAQANVWLTPRFALSAGYMTSLSGNVSDSADGSRDVPAQQEWTTVGLRTRRSFGGDRLAPVMTFGLDYSDSQFKVPSSALQRNKLSSKGVKISLDADIPTSTGYAWTIGFSFSPKLSHIEEQTDAQFGSGGGVEANAVGVSFGGKVFFERSDAMFWRLSYVVEKDQFSGQATANDPQTGFKPSGVSVVNGSALIQFGYTWSN